MEFFWIIVSNLFTGAIVYLLLSLKIERTTSSVHEKKLKREMNEIMTEFNAAAERNITILENRIQQVRNISNNNFPTGSVDIILSDDGSMNRLPSGSGRNAESEKTAESAHFFDKLTAIDHTDAELSSVGKSFDNVSGNELIGRQFSTGTRIDYKIEEELNMAELAKGEDIGELFRNATDKYSVINGLFERGYSIDEIARSSGMPVGEVRLVVSLNR